MAAMAVACAIVGLAGCGSSPKQAPKSAPTPEEIAYLQKIQIAPGSVEAAQNFLQHTVTTLHATVTNNGKKTVRSLEVNLTFSDIEGKPVQQTKAYAISENTPPLRPGETRPFHVSFDQVPTVWNQAPPQITPVRVVLAGD